MDEYLAEIRLFAGMFEPRNWMFCDGRELPIAQYEALFSLLGWTYGGNGQTTFRLPDFRGRVPVGAGTGPGIAPKLLGQAGGAEQHQLTTTQIPAHSHPIMATSSAGNATNPANAVYAASDGGDESPAYRAGPADAALATDALTQAGAGQPHSNMQPALGLNYIICVYGIYPDRN